MWVKKTCLAPPPPVRKKLHQHICRYACKHYRKLKSLYFSTLSTWRCSRAVGSRVVTVSDHFASTCCSYPLIFANMDYHIFM